MRASPISDQIPLTDFRALRAALPGATFTDATGVIRGLRMVKSEAEIAKIAHICRIASDAFDAAPRLFRAGQPLDAAFRAFKIELLSQGADDVPYLVGGAGPGGYDDVISSPSGQALQARDVLMLDTGSVFDGYFCDFDRNFAIQQADDAARRAYDVLYRATEAGLVAARPGASCADLFHAMQSVIAAAGGGDGDVGRLGHGLGMQLTEWPSHTAWDATPLVPGMVLTLEPGMQVAPGRIMVHEENLVVREGGAELLSCRAAPELLVLD
jgi:Xaa-Pro aminopeptidase